MVRKIGITLGIAVLYAGFSFSQSMKVYTKSSVKTFSLTDVDSITFELDEKTFPTDLRIAGNEMPNWAEDDSEYREFRTADDLYAIINGGAEEYLNRAMIKGFQQYMSRSGTDYEARMMVMDFGTIEKATSMYQYKAEQISLKVAAGGYNDTTAIIDPAPLTGCLTYAHFGQYYIELGFSGYGAEKSESYTDASGFLELFDSKIE